MSTGPRIAIAASPRKPNRNTNTTVKFQEAAGELSRRFEDSLSAPIQVGENCISAVLNTSNLAFDFAVALAEAVWPMRLTTSLVSVGHQVGPTPDANAHTRALAAVMEARRSGSAFNFNITSRKAPEMRMAETAALLHATIREDWTPTRAAAVRTYRSLGRQKEVAAKLGITQQAVSQMLRGARLRELSALEATMQEWLVEESRPGLWPLSSFEKGPALSAQA
jgi:hypothetical protein